MDVILTFRQPGLASEPDANDWDTAREDDGRRVLEGKGRGGITVNWRLTFDGARYALGNAPLPLRERIVRELAREPASANALTDMLGARRADVLAELHSLCSAGKVAPRGSANSPKRIYELVPEVCVIPGPGTSMPDES